MRGSYGLQVGIIAYGRAVKYNGGTECVVVVTAYLSHVCLCQIVERGIRCERTGHELQHVGKAFGLNVAHSVLIYYGFRTHGLLFGGNRYPL